MFISAPSQAVFTVWDFKALVKGIKAVSQTAMCCHTCVIPSSPALLASTKPSLPALKSCHTFFMMARAPGPGLVRNSACRGMWRQIQCCQYIMGDRGRFDDQGLTGTGLSSSSSSNLFVSAVILTDKQSACNSIWQNGIQPQRDLERWLLEWIKRQFSCTKGNKQQQTNRMCVCMFVRAQRGFHSYILLCECTHYDPRHTHTLYLNILSLALKQQTKEGSRSSCSLANGSCMLMPASESANAAKLMAGRHSFSSSCVSGNTSRKNHHEGR